MSQTKRITLQECGCTTEITPLVRVLVAWSSGVTMSGRSSVKQLPDGSFVLEMMDTASAPVKDH